MKLNLGKTRGNKDEEMAKECPIAQLPEGIIKLKTLTESLRFANFTHPHKGGAEWIEIDTKEGKALIRGLLKKTEVAVSDNWARKDTIFPTHQHAAHEVFIVYEGTMELQVNGETTIITANGKPYYFDARQKHGAFFPVDTAYIAITIPADRDWPEGG